MLSNVANNIDTRITNVETKVGWTTTDVVMGGAIIKGFVGLIVGLIFALDLQGWPLLDPHS